MFGIFIMVQEKHHRLPARQDEVNLQRPLTAETPPGRRGITFLVADRGADH
jgi:hypothetical protein